MTAMEKIRDFLDRNAGRAYCDDCLSRLLNIRPRQQVQQKTSRLALDNRYWRQCGPCHGHGRDNQVVIRVRTMPFA
jgi:hypothetical protein